MEESFPPAHYHRPPRWATLRQRMTNEARDPAFALLLVAIAATFVRTIDQPGVDINGGSISVKITPGDLIMAALAVVIAVRIIRTHSYPRVGAALTVAATGFAALILLSAATNGGTAFVAAAKLVELAVLLVGCIVLIDSADRLWAVVLVLMACTTVAIVWGLVGFAKDIGGRQAAFVGEHDLAAISTVLLVVGLAALHGRHRSRPGAARRRDPWRCRDHPRRGPRDAAQRLSRRRRDPRNRGLSQVAAPARRSGHRASSRSRLTGATYTMRNGELGFLQEWFAPAENAKPGQYAASWSQRLIYAYIGGRIFLDRPVLGAGWWGELPPSEYAQFLPDARHAFPINRERYFPRARQALHPAADLRPGRRTSSGSSASPSSSR